MTNETIDALEKRLENAEAVDSARQDACYASGYNDAKQVEDNLRVILAILERRLEATEQDTARLDWLSNNLAYAQMVNPQTNVMYSLPNKGTGWKEQKLREAIDAARKDGA